MQSFLKLSILVLASLTSLCSSNAVAVAHDGPDPVMHWQFNQSSVANNHLKARLGPDGLFSETPQVITDPTGESVRFTGRMMECSIAPDFNSVKQFLPQQAMTISAWVCVEEPQEWGGIIGVFQDNGDYEKGWVLGYDEQHFYFGLASQGSDDGNGMMTYLKGKMAHQPNKMFHVVAVYDGKTMELYVNGKLDARSSEQSGDIHYPVSAPFVMGAYRDKDEFNPMKGRIRDISIYDMAAKPEWVKKQFEPFKEQAEFQLPVRETDLRFLVKPFLQFGTIDGITVVWETSRPAKGVLCWGEDLRCENRISVDEKPSIQQVRIEGLAADTQYFYRVESTTEEEQIESQTSTFQTAFGRGQPLAFAVISDTQKNRKVAGQIADLAWNQRPHFLLHPGDLVDQGRKKSDWLEDFFPSMENLISRVPMFPVLGNHEQNADHYFQYMALPDPEYYYSFSYGDADFFMIDSNRKVDPESEQFQWLDQALSQSDAIWKFVCHHHPPFSSDENDYGDLWKTNQSTRGDMRVRQLVPLYEKHKVDIVWTGHIHSYERTWPIRGNRVVESGGTIYMITGGGGGSLETPGPYRPFFQNSVRRAHHYVMVHINGKHLELKVFDLQDRLFDQVKIEKRPSN